MHLETIANKPPVLLLDDKSDVLTANRAFVEAQLSAGEELPADYSITSYPFTMGGEFPKNIGPQNTEKVLAGLSILMQREVSGVEDSDK